MSSFAVRMNGAMISRCLSKVLAAAAHEVTGAHGVAVGAWPCTPSGHPQPRILVVSWYDITNQGSLAAKC